jgi:hypothetical protein
MAQESDGADEVVGGAMRIAATAAGALAEQAARRREQEARRAEAESVRARREFQAREAAELVAAGGTGVRERGADRTRAGERGDGSPRDGQRESDAAERSATAGRGKRADTTESAVLMTRAGIADRAQDADTAERAEAAEVEPTVAQVPSVSQLMRGSGTPTRAPAGDYDSTERRQQLAESLASLGDPELVQARMIVDLNRSQPAAEVLNATHERVPRARSSRGIGAGQNIQRFLSR